MPKILGKIILECVCLHVTPLYHIHSLRNTLRSQRYPYVFHYVHESAGVNIHDFGMASQ